MFSRLLVPTDLSGAATAAVRYALALANRLGTDSLTFYYANGLHLPVSTPLRLYRETEADMVAESTRKLRAYLDPVLEEAAAPFDPARMQALARMGELPDDLPQVVATHRPDLIVMGTHGATGLKKVFLGSNTVRTLGLGLCPVLAVPQAGTFAAEQRLLVALSPRHTAHEVAQAAALARALNATLTFFHIHQPDVTGSHLDLDTTQRLLTDCLGGQPFALVVREAAADADLRALIQAVAQEQQATLLLMVAFSRDWLRRLLTANLTQEVFYDSALPVLAFHAPGDAPGSGR